MDINQIMASLEAKHPGESAKYFEDFLSMKNKWTASLFR